MYIRGSGFACTHRVEKQGDNRTRGEREASNEEQRIGNKRPCTTAINLCEKVISPHALRRISRAFPGASVRSIPLGIGKTEKELPASVSMTNVLYARSGRRLSPNE